MKQIRYTLALLLFVAGQAFSQDYKKVADLILQVEENLKTMIAAEKQERQDQYAALLAKLNTLQPSEAKAAEVKKAEKKEEAVDVAKLLKRMQDGNSRFVKGTSSFRNVIKGRQETAKGQKPYVTVVTCSDSRVPPELIFDESIGQIFVVRLAGNVIDSAALGSIEYAAEHLHSGMVMVLGHESCGAVKATIEGGAVPPNIGSIVWRLQPAVQAMKAKGFKDKELISASVEENVRQQIAALTGNSDVMKELVEKNEVAVVGAVYNLETGAVSMLGGKNLTENVVK